MATQKEKMKLIKADMMAKRMKNIAKNLRNAADDYGVRFPHVYAEQMDEIADDYLKLK